MYIILKLCFGTQKTDNLDTVYWRVLKYSTVTGNIDHYSRMKPDNQWHCLQYWGDKRYRTNNLKNGLFLVAEGTGKSANFLLRPITELTEKENGIFSFT